MYLVIELALLVSPRNFLRQHFFLRFIRHFNFFLDEVMGIQRGVYNVQNLTGLKLKTNGKSFFPEICKELDRSL